MRRLLDTFGSCVSSVVLEDCCLGTTMELLVSRRDRGDHEELAVGSAALR